MTGVQTCALPISFEGFFYIQQAADAEYKRNLQMWKDTNFGAQRNEMEKAGLSVGLMYGNGGGSAASTAGGTATQPSAPNTNPVEVALQQQAYYRDWDYN